MVLVCCDRLQCDQLARLREGGDRQLNRNTQELAQGQEVKLQQVPFKIPNCEESILNLNASDKNKVAHILHQAPEDGRKGRETNTVQEEWILLPTPKS